MITAPPTNEVVTPGSTATFSVSAMSLLPMTYQWMMGATAINGATNTTLTLTNVTTNNVGSYAVVIATSYGSVTSAPAALSFPVVVAAFSLTAGVLPDGTLQLTTTNSPGTVFRVLGSTNLVNWQTLATVTNVTGTVQYTDPGATNFRTRFYRMVSP